VAEQSNPPICQPDSQGEGDAQAHPGDPIRQAARGRKDQKHGKYDATDEIDFVHFFPSPIKKGAQAKPAPKNGFRLLWGKFGNHGRNRNLRMMDSGDRNENVAEFGEYF
jgi:hypothetical protein